MFKQEPKLFKVRLSAKRKQFNNPFITPSSLEYINLGNFDERFDYSVIDGNGFEEFDSFIRVDNDDVRYFLKYISSSVVSRTNSGIYFPIDNFNKSNNSNNKKLPYARDEVVNIEVILTPITKEFESVLAKFANTYTKSQDDVFNKELKEIIEFLKSYQDSFIKYYLLGVANLFLKDYTKARKYLEEAKLITPNADVKKQLDTLIANSKIPIRSLRLSKKLRTVIFIGRLPIDSGKAIRNVIKTIDKHKGPNILVTGKYLNKLSSNSDISEIVTKFNADQIIFLGHGNDQHGFGFHFNNSTKYSFIDLTFFKYLKKKILNKKNHCITFLCCNGVYYQNTVSDKSLIYCSDDYSYQASEVFSAGFFHMLARGGSIEQSFNYGKLSLSLRSEEYFECILE